MALSKFRMNLAFAGIVVLLALSALAAAYFQTSSMYNLSEAGSRASDAVTAAGQTPDEAARRLESLEQMAAEHPENAAYQTQLANLHYDSGQFDKAAAHYQQSLKIRPQDPHVETDLATCYHYLGEHDKALEILDRVLKYSPDFSQAKYNKGIVLVNGKGDIKSGIAVWEEMLRSNPRLPQKEELEQKIRQLKKSDG